MEILDSKNEMREIIKQTLTFASIEQQNSKKERLKVNIITTSVAKMC